MQFVKSYYFSVLNIVAINDFPDETWEKEFGHLQLLNVPPALFLRVEGLPGVLATFHLC